MWLVLVARRRSAKVCGRVEQLQCSITEGKYFVPFLSPGVRASRVEFERIDVDDGKLRFVAGKLNLNGTNRDGSS